MLVRALEARHDRPRLRGTTLQLPSGDFEIDLRTHELDERLAALDRDEVDVAVISCPPTLELRNDLPPEFHARAVRVEGNCWELDVTAL